MRYRLEGEGISIGVDGDRLVSPDGRFDVTLRVGAGELRPGLINAHDHLHRNHYPRLGTPPYDDAYAWGRDLHARWAAEIARARSVPRRDALLFGALKNLLGGVTTVVHHDAWERDFDHGFPVHVARLRCIHSPGFDAAGVKAAAAAQRGTAVTPLTIHVAEGVNTRAADEIRALDRAGLLDAALLAVHVVGADDDGIQRLHAAGAATVWCPTSNLFLFGRTAPAALLRSGDVLLGTDALLTGAGTMLDELRAARALGCIHDDRLRAAVGSVAARRLGLGARTLEAGAPADIVLLLRPLFAASARDVTLVIVGGVPRLGAVEFAPLFEQTGVRTDEITVGDAVRLVCRPLGSTAERVLRAWPECGSIFLPDGSSATPLPVRATR
jgi:hypothetical protein